MESRCPLQNMYLVVCRDVFNKTTKSCCRTPAVSVQSILLLSITLEHLLCPFLCTYMYTDENMHKCISMYTTLSIPLVHKWHLCHMQTYNTNYMWMAWLVTNLGYDGQQDKWMKHYTPSVPSRTWNNLCRRQCKRITPFGQCGDVPPTIQLRTSPPLKSLQTAE